MTVPQETSAISRQELPTWRRRLRGHPRIQIRVFHKHRGVSKNFEQRPLKDAVLVAEHVEGIASVAHALAFCHAAECLAAIDVPWPARLVRSLYAELERIANHLDVMVKLTDAAGLAVATALHPAQSSGTFTSEIARQMPSGRPRRRVHTSRSSRAPEGCFVPAVRGRGHRSLSGTCALLQALCGW